MKGYIQIGKLSQIYQKQVNSFYYQLCDITRIELYSILVSKFRVYSFLCYLTGVQPFYKYVPSKRNIKYNTYNT